jgi:hypothetical protein
MFEAVGDGPEAAAGKGEGKRCMLYAWISVLKNYEAGDGVLPRP